MGVKLEDKKNKIAQKLRNNSTDTEKYLWKYLRGRQLEGFKFRRQHPIAKYIVDFINLERKIIIEVDGGQPNPLPPRGEGNNLNLSFVFSLIETRSL